MVALLVFLLFTLLLFGASFTYSILWWIAFIALIVWLCGFIFRGPVGPDRRRWYRW